MRFNIKNTPLGIKDCKCIYGVINGYKLIYKSIDYSYEYMITKITFFMFATCYRQYLIRK